jgi:uncharacterized coiled-coil protein SlyX
MPNEVTSDMFTVAGDWSFMNMLVLKGETFSLQSWLLKQQCELFATDPTLLDSPYHVKSEVRPEIFRLFLEAIQGTSATITNQNFSELSQLCSEFVFTGLANELSAFCCSPDFKDVRAADARIRVLEDHLSQVEKQIAALEFQIPKQEQTAEALNAALARVSHVESAVNSQATKQEETKAQIAALKAVTVHLQIWGTWPKSLLVPDIPPLFDEFRDKKWSLLWRGSRDGFGVRDFHSRCDGHANTVTLIQTAASEKDVGGFVFGGFTPVEWDSTTGDWKSDDSLKSFLFTLKNPHNIPARKFALKAEEKHKAIWCHSKCGPWFYAIAVSNNCNTNTSSWIDLGDNYTNDTGLDGRIVFTGSHCFKVKEIEVFEITD